jgi:hypothetical protein
MAAEDEAIACDFCKRGRVALHTEEKAFRQLSNKGYVDDRATIRLGGCDTCGSTSLGAGVTEPPMTGLLSRCGCHPDVAPVDHHIVLSRILNRDRRVPTRMHRLQPNRLPCCRIAQF